MRDIQFGPVPDGPRPQSTGAPRNLDLLLDVQVPVSVEVGSARMPISEVLELVPGSVVRLDKKAEDPVDLRVNGRLIARGEVVMVDDDYGLRITQICDPQQRIEPLRG